jgi:hypothetical protein
MAGSPEVAVQSNIAEFANNTIGNFFLGIKRERAPIFRGITGAAFPFLANLMTQGAFAASFLNPIGLSVGLAALLGGVTAAASSFLFDIRRKIFATNMPKA